MSAVKKLNAFRDVGIDLPIIQFNPIDNVKESFELLTKTFSGEIQMNKVAIVGTGQTKFSKHDGDVEKLLFESASNCIQSVNNCNSKDIEGVLVSTNNNSKYLGAILSETIGIQPKISHSIEHLCSSGTNAIISAYAYISSGLSDMILVSGAESATNPGQVLEWDKSRGDS